MDPIPVPLPAPHAPNDMRRYPASAKDWEEHREIIQRLYCAEDRPLPKVKDRMKELYGFDATLRQYKQRIAEWHLDKNVKDEEMRAILKLQHQRDLDGKRSVFYVRGRVVDPKKMSRFSKRKGTRGNLQDRRSSLDLPPDVCCYTPGKSQPESVVVEGSLQIGSSPSILSSLEPDVVFEDDGVPSYNHGSTQDNHVQAAQHYKAGKEQGFHPHIPTESDLLLNAPTMSTAVLDRGIKQLLSSRNSSLVLTPSFTNNQLDASSIHCSVPTTLTALEVISDPRSVKRSVPFTTTHINNETARDIRVAETREEAHLPLLNTKSPTSAHSTTLYGFDAGQSDFDKCHRLLKLGAADLQGWDCTCADLHQGQPPSMGDHGSRPQQSLLLSENGHESLSTTGL